MTSRHRLRFSSSNPNPRRIDGRDTHPAASAAVRAGRAGWLLRKQRHRRTHLASLEPGSLTTPATGAASTLEGVGGLRYGPDWLRFWFRRILKIEDQGWRQRGSSLSGVGRANRMTISSSRRDISSRRRLNLRLAISPT